MEICFATHNLNKLKEIQVLVPKGIQLVSLDDLGITEEIPETGQTLEENAELKARYVYERKTIPVFADDTGLEIEELGGEPGVYSARYAGNNKNSEANMAMVLQKLDGKPNRQACFRTIIAFIDASGNLRRFDGQVDGTITEEVSGSKGFGYDPIFKPDGYNITFAEMDAEEKNRISHRGRAFRAFLDFLNP